MLNLTRVIGVWRRPPFGRCFVVCHWLCRLKLLVDFYLLLRCRFLVFHLRHLMVIHFQLYIPAAVLVETISWSTYTATLCVSVVLIHVQILIFHCFLNRSHTCVVYFYNEWMNETYTRSRWCGGAEKSFLRLRRLCQVDSKTYAVYYGRWNENTHHVCSCVQGLLSLYSRRKQGAKKSQQVYFSLQFIHFSLTDSNRHFPFIRWKMFAHSSDSIRSWWQVTVLAKRPGISTERLYKTAEFGIFWGWGVNPPVWWGRSHWLRLSTVELLPRETCLNVNISGCWAQREVR